MKNSSIKGKYIEIWIYWCYIYSGGKYLGNVQAYNASFLPLSNGSIDYSYFLDELIDATDKLEVYKEKIVDSKLESNWFMPTLHQKEALISSFA